MLKLVISKSITVVTKILEGHRYYKSHLNSPLWLNNVVKVVIYTLSLLKPLTCQQKGATGAF